MPSTVSEPRTPPATQRSASPQRLLDLIGSTPLLDLSAMTAGSKVRLFAKAEFANPGGSVKDRPALAIVEAALRNGTLAPGRRLLDATSGNTGISYAMIGAARNIPVTLCVPANVSRERQQILRSYGAEVRLTDPLAGSDGAILAARRLAAQAPELYAYVDQYANPENWRAHYRATGPEIWSQTGGGVTHFVAGVGTSGTLMGVGRYLREHAAVRLLAVEPDSPLHGLEGLKHMESAIVPPIFDPTLADATLRIPTERAYAMVRELARRLGLRVGISSGANVAAALDIAAGLESGIVVTILCDGADRYLSERFWEAA
jgi:cysteine synthase B